MARFTRDADYHIISSAINDKLIRTAKRHSKAARTGIRKAFHFIGTNTIKVARDEIKDKSKKTGRIYTYRVNGKVYKHQASAPFEYPANRGYIPGPKYGRLKDSMDFKVTGSRQVEVGSTVKHGLFLEKGTKKMKPRPFLSKTAINQRGVHQEILERKIRESLEANLKA